LTYIFTICAEKQAVGGWMLVCHSRRLSAGSGTQNVSQTSTYLAGNVDTEPAAMQPYDAVRKTLANHYGTAVDHEQQTDVARDEMLKKRRNRTQSDDHVIETTREAPGRTAAWIADFLRADFP
jgi:hypothetical protein